MISYKDFERPDGSVDWEACDRAKKAVGDSCTECGAFLLFGMGHPEKCASCKALVHDAGAVHHASSVRCPHCRKLMDVSDSELYALYEAGEHEITCHGCDREFTVSTSVSFSFESPALAKQDDDDDSEEAAE